MDHWHVVERHETTPDHEGVRTIKQHGAYATLGLAHAVAHDLLGEVVIEETDIVEARQIGPNYWLVVPVSPWVPQYVAVDVQQCCRSTCEVQTS